MNGISRRSFACIGASLAIVYATAAARADDDRFFPDRSGAAQRERATGVLTDFGIGNKSGSLTLKTAAGSRTFYVSEHIMLDGKPIACDHPPAPGFRPSAISCSSWPKNVVIGRTQVRVTYWTQTRPDLHERVQVAERIDSQPHH
ncbi:MAG: hypothetical protein IAI50_03155 [Candidatus Eremiobacteraeota bacterium]|nr:hypothetical protein [Candidatus Eremiobacteraeota bacterium]